MGLALFAAGSAVGPLVGGALTDLFGWRWFFFVNLPVAALTILLVLAIVPESRDETATGPFDRLGFVKVTAGLAALAYGLQWRWAWPGSARALPSTPRPGPPWTPCRRTARGPPPGS